MKRVLVAVAVALSCMACQSETTGDIDDVEKTLSSIEADLNEP